MAKLTPEPMPPAADVPASAVVVGPTPRWYQLQHHDVQRASWDVEARFEVKLGGRRAGKSETAKRKVVKRALMSRAHDGWFWLFAPTHGMARRIFWTDLKALVPRDLMLCAPREGDMVVRLAHGPKIQCCGLDVAQNMRGVYIDGAAFDEFDYMKPDIYEGNLRPALSTKGRPPGWAIFLGTPNGRGPLWRMYQQRCLSPDPQWKDWVGHRWSSKGIVSDEEYEAAKREMDPRLFAQEYDAEALVMEGLAYHQFDRAVHAAWRLGYDADAPLYVCFDFNVEPGVAVIAQERKAPDGRDCLLVIGEVWIPRNSNTPRVCKRVVQDWGAHRGLVRCYGDATGGGRHTSGVLGTDWDLIRNELRPTFGDRLRINVKKANPPEKARLNAVNAMLCNAAGLVSLWIDPTRAPHVVDDFEGVPLLAGGSGEIDKDADDQLTHLTDALGYLVESRHPVRSGPSLALEVVR